MILIPLNWRWRDGVPYAIDFGNPAPDAERAGVGEENFEWVVETAAAYAIERALAQKDGVDNLTWGEYVKRGAGGPASYFKIGEHVHCLQRCRPNVYQSGGTRSFTSVHVCRLPEMEL